MDFDSSKCFEGECPEDYFEFETDFGDTYCVQNCADYEYWDQTYFTCLDCEFAFDNCVECHTREEDPNKQACTACGEGFNPANTGVGCTPCEDNEYFFKEECLECDGLFPFCETCIQYPLLDYAPQQCLSCYGWEYHDGDSSVTLLKMT